MTHPEQTDEQRERIKQDKPVVNSSYLLLYLLSAHPHLRIDYDLMSKFTHTNTDMRYQASPDQMRVLLHPYVAAAKQTGHLLRNQKLQNAWQAQGGYWSERSGKFVKIGVNWNKQIEEVLDKGYLNDDGTLLVHDEIVTLEGFINSADGCRKDCKKPSSQIIRDGNLLAELERQARSGTAGEIDRNNGAVCGPTGVGNGNCSVQSSGNLWSHHGLPIPITANDEMMDIDQGVDHAYFQGASQNGNIGVRNGYGMIGNGAMHGPGQTNPGHWQQQALVQHYYLDPIQLAHQRRTRMNEIYIEHKRLRLEQQAFQARMRRDFQDTFDGRMKTRRLRVGHAVDRHLVDKPAAKHNTTKNGSFDMTPEERFQKMNALQREYDRLCVEQERAQTFGHFQIGRPVY